MKFNFTAALGGLFLAALGSANAAVWAEVGDAGDLAASAPQAVVGAPDSLDLITGTTTGPADFVDAYLISIDDPAAFYATTEETIGLGTGFADFDTHLYLFDPAGLGVLGNDDHAGAPFHSLLADPALFPTLAGGPGLVDATAAPFAPGDYVLAIAGWASGGAAFPLDGAGGFVIDTSTDTDALFGPVGGALAGWAGPGEVGAYGIELGGAVVVPEPSAGILGLFGLAALLRRRRR